MIMKNSIQSKVMRKAHEFKTLFNGLTWSQILCRAWEFVKAQATNAIESCGLVEIKDLIEGNGFTRVTGWNDIFNFTALMELADRQGNFVSDIIERALKGSYVSSKQAWCVAYFAQRNGLVK